MFPVKDDIPTDRLPVVTLTLIAANLLVFVLAGADAALDHGLVPDAPRLDDALASMFVHTGWLHLLANMLFLWLFGPNVEDAVGRLRCVAFYVVGGLIALGAQVAVDPSSTAPLAGASGAVATVMGGYLRLYPWARILCLAFLLFFFTIFELPVVVLLALWVALQAALALADPGTVAWAAHLAGFVFGLAVVRLLAVRVKTPESLLARRGMAAS